MHLQRKKKSLAAALIIQTQAGREGGREGDDR